MIAGFYIFQIFDSFNEAKKTDPREITETNGKEKISLFGAVIIVIIGIFFQLAQLDIIRYRDLKKLWPLVLIILGGRYLYIYVASSKSEKQENRYPLEKENGGQNE